LKLLGIGRGDPVAIYLPTIPEAVIAMLACARIGAVHSVVFAGCSADSLADSIQDCGARLLITADEGVRGGRRIPLKRNADAAFATCPSIEWCLVVRRAGADVPWSDWRDKCYEDVIASASVHCPPAEVAAEEPLFILYTSGSTGRPEGVLHSTGGYLVACAMTHQHILDCHDGDVYWCTADVGWVTGHSYAVYGPLANGATTLIFEGVPDYPTDSRIWEVVDKHRVNILYTTPPAVRALMRHDADPISRASRQSLRILGTVGGSIKPEAWPWYCKVAGEWRRPVIDTWWQTETGAILVAPPPGATGLKPDSATRPFFGVQPVIVDDQGRELQGACQGNLCLRDGGPGMMRTVHGDHERFVQTYFTTFPGLYFTSDGCRRDQGGDYEIIDCVDDVMDASDHRLVTAEIESALVAHPQVAEAAVVGYPHDLKGQGIYAFVTLRVGEKPSEQLRRELALWVCQEISPIAAPDLIQWAPALPKTRSGKIMRRILRKIASHEFTVLGGSSTLADPSAVGDLVATRQAVNRVAG
jgi:acetyl-CoA synthetase